MNSETPSSHPDEIDLKDIIQPLWAAKWRLLLWGLVFVLITGIYQLGGVALNKDDSGRAQMQVHFNFEFLHVFLISYKYDIKGGGSK